MLTTQHARIENNQTYQKMFPSTLKLSSLLKKSKLPSSYCKNNFFNFFYSNNQQHCSFSHNINHITQHQEKACSDNDNSSPSSSSREKLRDMIQQYSHSIPDHLVRASSRMNPSATTVATEQHEINKSRKLSIDLPMDPKKPYGDNIQMKEIKLRKQKTTLELHFTINNNPQSLVVTSLLAEFLRVESPSAEVQGEGGQKRLVFGKRGIKISNIEMVGTYAIRIIFSDGHDSGIYSWNYLHALGKHKYTMMKQYINDLRVANKSRNARVPKSKPSSASASK